MLKIVTLWLNSSLQTLANESCSGSILYTKSPRDKAIFSKHRACCRISTELTVCTILVEIITYIIHLCCCSLEINPGDSQEKHWRCPESNTLKLGFVCMLLRFVLTHSVRGRQACPLICRMIFALGKSLHTAERETDATGVHTVRTALVEKKKKKGLLCLYRMCTMLPDIHYGDKVTK